MYVAVRTWGIIELVTVVMGGVTVSPCIIGNADAVQPLLFAGHISSTVSPPLVLQVVPSGGQVHRQP